MFLCLRLFLSWDIYSVLIFLFLSHFAVVLFVLLFLDSLSVCMFVILLCVLDCILLEIAICLFFASSCGHKGKLRGFHFLFFLKFK